MNFRKTSRTRHTLPLALLFGVLPVTLLSAKTEYTPTAQEQSTGKQTLSTVILNRAREQLLYIDLVLEELAHASANNKLGLKNTHQVSAYITQLRELATQARQYSAHNLTPESAHKLVELNNLLLKRISRALTYKFRFTPKVNTDITAYFSRSAQDSAHTPTRTLDIVQAHTLLLKNDDLLLAIPKQYTQLGVTPRQRLARQTIKYLQNSKAITAGKRVLPYVGLGAYYILINKKEALPDCWLVQKTKEIFGQLPKSSTIYEVTDKRNEIKSSEDRGHNQDQHDQEQNNQQRQDSGAGVGLEQQSAQQEQNFVNNNNQADLVLAEASNITVKSKSHTEKGEGIGALFNVLGKLVGIETKPLYTITPAIFFLPIIKRDLQDLGKLTSRVTARITGDTPKNDTLTKQSKLTFDTIVGFEHIKQRLQNIVGYFKHKKLFKRTGASADKSYMLVGSLDLGKQFAYALTGEITKQFTAQNKNKRCGIYELHASALINKKLTHVLKDLEAETPCVVLLQELDWLVAHETDTAVWADLQAAYAQLERKDIIIVATVESARALDKLHAQQSFGVLLELGLPTDDEHAAFIKQELEKYALLPAHVNSTALAHQTAGCSYAQISKVLEKALNTAHTTRTILTQEHIERTIDELIYGIVPCDTLSGTEKTMLAAYYAGKTVAHKCLYNDQSILKVTLLPVRKHNGQEQGALITTHDHTNNLTCTRSELEKQAIIELAGIQAQRMLLGHASRALEEQANKYAFTQAKTSILEGINEYDLPKKAREDILHQAWDMTTECNRQAQELVKTHKNTLQVIADKLVEHKTLSTQEIN